MEAEGARKAMQEKALVAGGTAAPKPMRRPKKNDSALKEFNMDDASMHCSMFC
jgi:hypothetical protein